MAKRQSLANFSPKPQAHPQADDAKIIQEPVAETVTTQKGGKKYKYPHITVYLTEEEVRTLKLLHIDTGQKVTDIAATAIREWLQRNGHARSGKQAPDA